jgi:murein L,D-transpeptidase YcbB/YkuD
MCPPRFTIVVVFSVLALAIVVSRKPAGISASLPQQAAVGTGQTLTPPGVSALRALADSARIEDLRWPNFAAYQAEFKKFYEANGYSLVWVQNGQVRPQTLAAIQVLENAGSRGLDPEDYDGSRWPARVPKANSSEQDLVLFDTEVTVSAMRYIRAVHAGRVNPKEFNFQLDNGEEQFSLAEFLQNHVANSNDPAAEIQKLEPPFLGYRKLLALLPVYQGYASKDDGEKLQATAKTLKPGQPYASLARLGRFLQLIGDIPAATQLEPNATIYDGTFVEGVKHYQDRHGESPTGELDARTINELNTPPAVRIDLNNPQLAIAEMERLVDTKVAPHKDNAIAQRLAQTVKEQFRAQISARVEESKNKN